MLLRLNNNQHSGNIPTEIGNLGSLQDLRLNNNKLSGRLPMEIGNLTNLYDDCNLFSNTDLCFPPYFSTSSVCKRHPVNSSIPTCPSLYSCINGNCTITTDTGGTYYQNSCHVYCKTTS